MKQYNAVKAVCLTACLVAPITAFATNGYQLIGIGSYQKSLGGAVTANPNTAMTAISNPAGMTRIGKRADFSLEAFMPERFTDFSGMGGEKETSAVGMYGVPALGWSAPISETNSDAYFGGGIYGTSGLGVDYASTLMMPVSPFLGAFPAYYDAYSSISFWQMAPTLAWNVDKRLSLGVSLNIDYQAAAFKQRVMLDTDGDGEGDSVAQNFDLSRTAQGFGLGLTLGVLYDVSEAVTLGATYKSKQEFSDMEYQLAYGDINNVPTSNCGGACPSGTYKLALDFPQQMATGITYRPTNRLALSGDIKWIDWSSTMDELKIDGPGAVKVTMPTGWEDQMVYALGISFAATDRLNVRGGLNYGKAPIDEEDVSNNMILPATVETHYTVGMDYRLNKLWELGFHYMYAPEKTFTAPATDATAPGAEIGLSEQSFGINLGTFF